MHEVVYGIREYARRGIRWAAKWFSRIAGDKVTPFALTIFGLLMYVPIAILIARGRFAWAGVLLIIFSLFGAVNDEIVRLQKRSKSRGILFNVTASRLKEVLLYSGAGFYLASGDHPATATWAVMACGVSLVESYVQTKGEIAVASSKIIVLDDTLKRMITDGLLTFEVRMFLFVLGLITGQLLLAVIGIAVLALLTTLQRFLTISEKLE